LFLANIHDFPLDIFVFSWVFRLIARIPVRFFVK